MHGDWEIKAYFEQENCPSIVEHNKYEIEQMLLHLLKYNISFKNKKVLILGSGDATLESKLCKMGKPLKITLIDLSENLLLDAKKKIPFADIIKCNLKCEKEKIKDVYDVIISFSVMQYFSHKNIVKINLYLLKHLNKNGVIFHFNIPDNKRKLIYRINNSIVMNNIKYMNKKYDFIDKFSLWCDKKSFLFSNVKTTFYTPSFNWERFDVKLEKNDK